ncbi:hypothetical protein KAR52_02935 [Candidatus Pacearchaeota archaeon]|nr:hypothetical protein [Candidatus Pacearchaeota archaeon]
MENLVGEFAKFVVNVSPHETLAGILRNKLNEQQKVKRKNYFGVVDICNPLKTYFKLTYPKKFKDSVETKKRFSIGNRQHKITEKKIEQVEGFIDKEIILDGELIGIALKGRVDAKVKKSLWEIKSKEELPKNKEELVNKYPQDLEQLSFYSILDPEKPEVNYIIFTNQTGPEKYKAFKIKILDFGKIKNLALNRIKKLNEWLDGKVPDDSLRCRYCYDDCIFKANDICSQHENEILPCEVERFVEIGEAPEIEKILEEIKFYNIEEELIKYSIFNLIMPRKAFHKENEDIEDKDYDSSERQLNKQLIQNLVYKSNYRISFEDFKKLEDSKKIKEIYQNKNSFIKFTSNGKEMIFPILIHISDSIYPPSLNKVYDYKKGELGIHCFNNGFNKGYLISFFPKQNNELRVFEISYNFNREAIKPLKNVVEILKAKDKEKVKELPKCPDFIHRNECVYKCVCPKD